MRGQGDGGRAAGETGALIGHPGLPLELGPVGVGGVPEAGLVGFCLVTSDPGVVQEGKCHWLRIGAFCNFETGSTDGIISTSTSAYSGSPS